MAADVSSLVRILSRYKDDRTLVKDSTMALMTRDLLGTGGSGGGGDDHSLELDLDLHVPNGWEKRLDLKSGKVYLQQQCNSMNSSSSTHHHYHQTEQSNRTIPRFQDLNFPPISSKAPAKPLLSLFEDNDKSLELKLLPSSSSPPPPFPPLSSSSSSSSNHSLSYLSSLSVSSANSSFQSVCTLDKVKSALERAEKNIKKRQSPDDNDGGGFCRQTASAATTATSPVATGCPECLSYVLVTINNPTCPRCHSFVPLPTAIKKPKIDLNMSI